MKYFKKYPIFFIAMLVLIALFIAGAAYDVMLYNNDTASLGKLNSVMRQYDDVLATDPTQPSIDASAKNIKELEKHLADLEKDLTRESEHIFKPLTAEEGFQLREQLRGMVNSWRAEAKKRDIYVPDEMDFGYKKYVAPTADSPKDEAMPAIWKQVCVLDYINQKLFNCKSKESPMAILNVQREILPEEGIKEETKTRRVRASARSKSSAALRGDNFKIDENITARKPGSLNTLAYRFVFTGHTDVLRRFLNQLKDFDAMLVVRSIDVKPADTSLIMMANPEEALAEETSDAADAFASTGSEDGGEAPAAPVIDENKVPVVTDNISEFTVVIEYVEVVKDTAKPGDKKDADKNGAAGKKAKAATKPKKQ